MELQLVVAEQTLVAAENAPLSLQPSQWLVLRLLQQ